MQVPLLVGCAKAERMRPGLVMCASLHYCTYTHTTIVHACTCALVWYMYEHTAKYLHTYTSIPYTHAQIYRTLMHACTLRN